MKNAQIFIWPKGRLNHPWAIEGGSTAPKQLAWGWPNHPLAKWGGRPPPPMGWPATYLVFSFSFSFSFFFFFFLKKKKGKEKRDEGILRINRPNMSNCHNLKVWGLSVTFENLEVKVKMGK
jgi:hypothetical protein